VLLTIIGYGLLIGGVGYAVGAALTPDLLLKDFWAATVWAALGRDRTRARVALVVLGLVMAGGGAWLLWG
jgi:hypothetical protein